MRKNKLSLKRETLVELGPKALTAVAGANYEILVITKTCTSGATDTITQTATATATQTVSQTLTATDIC